MATRKNLNQLINGDRDDVRAAKAAASKISAHKVSKPHEFGDWDDWRSNKGGFAGSCFETHPGLALPSGAVIYGGSCSRPVVPDADIYIGFDSGMRFTERHWPWKKGQELLFSIPDMQAPAKPEEFKKLVSWARKQLAEGAKIHCGCIGGHGRTGTFLAAVCAEEGVEDPIAYVRERYCRKAIETSTQVKFLVEHFGAKPQAGHKETHKAAPALKKGKAAAAAGLFDEPDKPAKTKKAANVIDPLRDSELSIWAAPGTQSDRVSSF